MHEQYDIVILGAGINGVSIARALSLAGKRVLILERREIAAGASSHSSRLIHGGLRYLENYEFTLVQEALHDQKELLDRYPDLVKLCPFYLPIYQNTSRPVWMIRIGLWLYGLLAGHGHTPSKIPMAEFSSLFPALRTEGLKAVFHYYDGKTDDKALTHRIAEEAVSVGTTIREHTLPTAITFGKEKIKIQTNDTHHIETPVLINATGAWVDEVNTAFALPSSFTIEKLSGIHLVFNKVLIPEPLILQATDGRVFFMIPEQGRTLIGTTERSEKGNVDQIRIDPEDIAYLLMQSNAYLINPLKEEDITDVFIGTRPIIKSTKDPTHMSREYKLDLHTIGKNKLLHIYGGKLTTSPSLARNVAKIFC
ncbi:MAG TPA: glycerol-3-phosphate dehydrogenase/oxidase [Epsilonproteobacteria bacterium]|nr:glycerol-3-phosphate dehydrogenase/oxidase [Campylobacterota bacterium]